MDVADAGFHVPFILRSICYLSAMSLLAAAIFWLAQHACGRPGALTLRQITFLWLARIIAACSILSLADMALSGRLASHAVHALPETAILFLLLALFLLQNLAATPRRAEILIRLLPLEIGKVFAVGGICIAALLFFLAALQGLQAASIVQAGPPWLPVFALGGFLMLALAALFWAAEARSPVRLKFRPLLWPAIFACLLVMLPDALEELGNSPKIDQFLHAAPRLQKA